MMEFLKANLTVWVAVFALAPLGCGQKTAGVGQKIAGTGATSGVGALSPTTQGTIDGGGGAGFNGLPLESYHRDIRKLPEYQNQIAPILATLGKLNPEFEKIFLHIVADRTWLFMNAPIPKLPKERQGTPFNIDQWAAQNSKEIQFSDEFKGSEEARGRILLHEILVGLKIMRFLSYNEYCYAWSTEPLTCRGMGNDQILIQDYKLDDLDHQDVRAMGDWLWDNFKTMNAKQFGDRMHTFQFQSPHYTWRAAADSASFEARLMNPTIDHTLATHLSLFTKFDYHHQATAKCEIDFSGLDAKHFKTVIHVVALKDKKPIETLTYTVVYDPKAPLKANPVFSVYERYIPVQLGEEAKLNQLGDRKKVISLNFENEIVSQFGALEQRVDAVENGIPMAIGDYSAPGAVLCEADPVEKPVNFGAWLEMRQPIRDLLERQYYGGKTWEERMIEAYDREQLR